MERITFFGNSGVLHEGIQSTVVRVLNVAKRLENHGIVCTIEYTPTAKLRHIMDTIERSDTVFFHRIQASRKTAIDWKYLFAFLFSWTKGKRKIFDFDDAIFLTYPAMTETLITGSEIVFAGSHYLYDHALLFNPNTYLIPSSIDTDIFKPTSSKKACAKEIIIGWHGSAQGHLKNLSLLFSTMNLLGKKYDVTFRLLGTKGCVPLQSYFRKMIPSVKLDFGPQKWLPYEELPRFISDMDISVSPLVDSRWSRGKCAMKALESMAVGIPVVASPVGEHRYIIEDGKNGFLSSDEQEWSDDLTMLIEDSSLRKKLGANARRLVEEKYSLELVSSKVLHLVRNQA